MDRGYRRILHATTILALPLALLVASFAVADEPARPQRVQPGGILQAFTKPAVRTATPRATNGNSQVKPVGLIDNLFGKNNTNPRQKNAQEIARKNAEVNANRAAPNWDGIPFHEPKRANVQGRTANTPIRDPSQSTQRTVVANPAVPKPPALSQAPSVLQGSAPQKSVLQKSVLQKSGKITATPASSRIQPRPQSLKSLRPQSTVRESARRVTQAPVISKPLPSTTASSRRSGRRTLEALNRAEVVPTPKELTAPVEVEADLVPKVSRRRIEANKPEPAPKKQLSELAPMKPAPKSASVKPVQKAKPAAKKLTVIEKPLPKVAAKPVPQVQPTAKPKAKLAAPEVAELKAAPAPSQRPAPTPPAATPSKPVAHRIGPAPSDFAPLTPVKEMELAPRSDAMKPIGSGVLNPADNESDDSAFAASPQPAAELKAPAPMRATPMTAAPFKTVPLTTESLNTRPATAAPRLAQTPSRGAPVQRQRVYSSDPYAPIQTQPYQAQPYQPQPAQAVPTQPTPAFQQVQPAPVANNPNAGSPVANEMRDMAPAKRVEPGKTGVASELPGIRVVTHGPDVVMIRQTHQFEIRVENRGSINAEGVMVRAMIPDWADVRGQSASRGSIAPQKVEGNDRLVWTIDQLPAGASERMVVSLKAERSGTHGLDVDWTLMPQKSVTKIKVHEPRLQLTIEGPEQIVYGKSQSYRVRVLNPGDGIAPNVVFTLSPNSSTPQTQRIGNIPPGKEAQFEVELTAQDLGNLKIDGLATGDLELRAVASKTIQVAAAKLEATLSGPELKYQDTDAVYHLQLQNAGVAVSENVVATLQLPSGVKYLGGLDNATQRGSMLQWEIKSLPPTATRDYQFRCKMSATGEQSLAFNCKGSAAGDASVSIMTTVESIADLVMTINDPAAPAPVGSDVTYEIVIRNRGSKAADDVRAIAQFSHGIEPRRVDGHSGEILTGQVLFDPITRIAPGQEVKLRVVAKADRAGHHRFRSEIRSGDTVLVSEEATHYMAQRTERVSRRSSETPQTR